MLPKVSDFFLPNFFVYLIHWYPFSNYFVWYDHVLPGEYVDMVKAGLIDPLKVIRTALVDANSSLTALVN